MRDLHCAFGCGYKATSRANRKTHNKTCHKNVNREKNRELSRKAQERHAKWRANNPHRGSTLDPDTFSEMFDDLPDGAFFAMAEEFGIQPEDFIR